MDYNSRHTTSVTASVRKTTPTHLGRRRVGQKVGKLLEEVGVLVEQQRHLLIDMPNGTLPLAIRVEYLQKRLVHLFIVCKALLCVGVG